MGHEKAEGCIACLGVLVCLEDVLSCPRELSFLGDTEKMRHCSEMIEQIHDFISSLLLK